MSFFTPAKNSGNKEFEGIITISSATASTGNGDGALVLSGAAAGLGMAGNLNVGGNADIDGTLSFDSGIAIDGIIDDDTMATASATTLATSESIVAYVSAQVGGSDTLQEAYNNFTVAAGTPHIVVGTSNKGAFSLEPDGTNITNTGDVFTVQNTSNNLTARIAGDGDFVFGDTAGTTGEINGSVSGAEATLTITGFDSASTGRIAIGTSLLQQAIDMDTTDSLLKTSKMRFTSGTSALTATAAAAQSVQGIGAFLSDNLKVMGNVGVAGTFQFYTGGGATSGASVDTILDEDDMASDSATALCTQQSIKAYVDSVAAGLDPKASVHVATLTADGNIPGYDGVGDQTITIPNANATFFPGAGGSAVVIDGITMELNDRVLVKDQTSDLENGIYYVTAIGAQGTTDAVLTRATDHDGTPANEISAGNYTFVEQGTEAGVGFVLLADGAVTDPLVPGTNNIVWSKFSDSGAAALIGGDGIDISGSTISIDLATTSGLEFDGGSPNKLRLAAQGNGIAGGAGSLLSVDSDTETGGSILGVNVTSNGVGIDVDALDGNGLTVSGTTLVIDPDTETGGNILGVNLTANGVGIDVAALDGNGLTASGTELVVDSDTETGGSILGVNVTANGVGIDVDALDGTGLAVSGTTLVVDSDTETGGSILGVNLTANGVGIDVAALDGNGLTVSGTELVIDPDSETGGNIEPVNVTANGVGINIGNIAGVGLSADGAGNLDVDTSAVRMDVSATRTDGSTPIALTETVVICDGTFTLALPAVSASDTGKVLYIKNIGTGNVTIDGDGGDTIDGATTFSLNAEDESITIVLGTAGTDWHIV